MIYAFQVLYRGNAQSSKDRLRQADFHLWLAGLIRRCGRCAGGVTQGSTSAVVEGFPVEDDIGQVKVGLPVVLQQDVNVLGPVQNKAQLAGLVTGERDRQPPGRMRALYQWTRRRKEGIHGGLDWRGVAFEETAEGRACEIELDPVMALWQVWKTMDCADGSLSRFMRCPFDLDEFRFG